MDQEINAMGMLDLMVRPGFCVQNNTIIKVNQAAQSHMIATGMDVRDYLHTGSEEYANFSGGCLYLTLDILGALWGASVTRMDDFHVFILDQEDDQAELQAMALAARELREPLTSVMTTADRLFPMIALEEDPALQEQVARLNRGLFQMLRVISNMSDANRYSSASGGRMETLDICGLFEEIFSKAQDLVSHTGIQLTFRMPKEPVYAQVDPERLERAVLNIVSNAVKFTPGGGTISAVITRRSSMLYLTVQDTGEGIPGNLKGSIHSRYLRKPAIEDSRFGIGLGMVLIRSTAAQHGGTVLIDQPEGTGTRITMTISIRPTSSGTLRSPTLKVDYAGERDHGLIELSASLPAQLYEVKKVN